MEMTQVIYDKWLNGSLIKHEITEDENGHPTWRIKDSWVGLTDDEIIDMYFQANINPQPHGFIIDFIRAIEQALKEKNHG